MGRKNILADIQYNPYTVLIAHIEGDQYFRKRTGLAANSEASDIFTRECSRYYRTLKANLDAFAPYAGHTAGLDIDGLVFDTCLFNPVCFAAFGETDTLAIVAMDDFDLATHLISQADLPIRQTCLAFSPTLESLGLQPNGLFCELKDICVTPLDHRTDLSKMRAPRHNYLRTRPLVAVTYYKFNGTAVLGPGLLMQQTAYRAMAREIENAIADIKALSGPQGNNDEGVFRAAGSFRCMFLDPQGWSDLVSVMLCSDYSVIETVVARIRCLTHERLYQEYPKTSAGSLEDHVKCFGLHKRLAEVFTICAKTHWREDCTADEVLRNNHILCSTFTTLGISHEAFEQTDKKHANYGGSLLAQTRLVCSPGHCTKVRQIAKQKYRPPRKMKPGCSWYCIGHSDYVYQQLADDNYSSDDVFDLFDFVQQVKSMRGCPIPGEPNGNEPLDPHILEAYSDLRIPIIEGITLSDPKAPHVETRLILDRIKERLFGEDLAHGMGLERLRRSLNTIQLPVPLSDSLLFLFVDYANSLCDVFLFDHVVDLHDIFTAVFDLLTRTLPMKVEKKPPTAYDGRAFLDTGDPR